MLDEILPTIISDNDYSRKITKEIETWLCNNKKIENDLSYNELYRIQEDTTRLNSKFLSCTKIESHDDLKKLARNLGVWEGVILKVTPVNLNETSHVLVDLDLLSRNRRNVEYLNNSGQKDAFTKEREVVVYNQRVQLRVITSFKLV